MPKLIDRLVSKIDLIRQRVNVDKVGVRRYQLFRVLRTWSDGEVGGGIYIADTQEITPAPAITLGQSKDQMSGRGRVESWTMTATNISLRYSEGFLYPLPLAKGQELYYKLVEMNSTQAARPSYWIVSCRPEADRDETTTGDTQWIMNFARAQIAE
jgi:hypothetical protein